MPAQYDPTPHIPGGTFQESVSNADISFFDKLAAEAGTTRNKGAGRNLITRRNALLTQYDPYQRHKVGQTYYGKQNKRAGDEGSFFDFGGPEAGNFIDLINDGDDQFLQGLADDPGTGTPPGGGSGSTSGGNDWQETIRQLLANQQNQFNSTLASFQNSAPTLSVGSVSNAQGTAASRARARNAGGIVNTLSRRGRQSSQRPRRYF